jgi:dolichol-phosphate mannosyltransferase
MGMVSLVLPVYNERDNLAPLLGEIEARLQGVEHEVVAVDDGSTDSSLEELRRLRAEHAALRVLALERHTGQSASLAAGFDAALGEIVTTMDADGQNDPADVPALIRVLEQNTSCAAVVGYRANRADSGWKRLQSSIANSVRNLITGDSIRDTGCSLKAIRREALTGLPRFNGMHRFLSTLIRLQGGTVIEAPVSHRPRLGGRSKYGMWNRALRALRDAIGVRWLGRRALRYEATEHR